MVFMAIVLFCLKDILFLFVDEAYRSGAIIFPFLVISPVCYTIAETTGIGINISKKSYLNIITYGVALGVNFLLCFLLIPKYEILGAAIAVAISSVSFLLIKSIIGEFLYNVIDNRIKSLSSVVILVLAAYLDWKFSADGDTMIRYCCFGGMILFLSIIYIKEVIYGIRVFISFFKRKSE